MFLEQHLKTPHAWNGRSAELAYGDDGASQAATGLLRLVLDRFIHVLEYELPLTFLLRIEPSFLQCFRLPGANG